MIQQKRSGFASLYANQKRKQLCRHYSPVTENSLELKYRKETISESVPGTKNPRKAHMVKRFMLGAGLAAFLCVIGFTVSQLVIPKPSLVNSYAPQVENTPSTGIDAPTTLRFDTSPNPEPVAKAIKMPPIEAHIIGKFNPRKYPQYFKKVGRQYTKRSGMIMQVDAYNAFKKMANDAKKDGVKLLIVSSLRTFYQQKSIWEAKWTGARLVGGIRLNTIADKNVRAKKILMFSSMPGTSRHHWGTDIDLNALENSYFNAGIGKKTYEWLVANAHKYGFYQPYSVKDDKGVNRSVGYEEEKWHWSYLPVADKLLAEYTKKISYKTIKGFQGAETAKSLNVIRDYVRGINPEVLNYSI